MNVQFWKDRATRELDPDLFSTTAEALAKAVNKERVESRDKLNKPTQIRKFYDEVIRYQGMVQSSPEDFASLLPYIKMLNAKAAYATGRDLIGSNFKGFVDSSLKQVVDRQDFDIFCTFFEAFMGFYKFCAEKENGGGGQYGQREQHGFHQGQRR